MTGKILATYDVARTIIKCSASCDVETGGLLAGTLAGPITIVAAGSPGANAVHHASCFVSDPIADKRCLQEARNTYGSRIEPVGWWHKHPLGLDRPSSGDCHQVSQLSAQYGDGKPILMGIVNRKSCVVASKTSLRIYSIDAFQRHVEHDWQLVTRKNKHLLTAISEAPDRPGTKLIDYWQDKDFQSYLNPVGRDRIKQEIEKLKKADWQVRVGRLKQNELLVIEVFDGLSELKFVLPPEFPLNPPTVLTVDGRCFQGLDTLIQWNSTGSLAEVAEQATSVMHCRHCSGKYVTSIPAE